MGDDIAKRILEHFRNGGTLDDGNIAALYRSANGLAPETETDAAVVGRWAFDTAARLRLNAPMLPAVMLRTPRNKGADQSP